MKNISKKQAYFILFIAIFASSFVTVFSKTAVRYPLFSLPFLFYYGIALFILAAYSVTWQLILEKLSLISAYLSRGILFVLIYIWSAVIFNESLSHMQIAGAIIIVIGVGVSQYGKESFIVSVIRRIDCQLCAVVNEIFRTEQSESEFLEKIYEH